MPKLLVVDKTIFHTLHHCDDELCAFVRKYNVVLPHTLVIECVISEKKIKVKSQINY
jgi:diadenosine tetraphosphate (Ap4A) HIT family hydrolase